MTDDESDDIRSTIRLLDLEHSITELRDGIGALKALGPYFAIGDAGVLWIAGKLEDAIERLFEDWKLLIDAARADAMRKEEDS